MIRWVLKLIEFNIRWEHRSGTQNAVADVLSRNSFESLIGEKVSCAIIRDLVLLSSEQLIEEQRKDLELGHIYSNLESPEDTSVCDESVRNLSTNLLRRLSGEYKFAFISNQLQKEVWDI
ncbi:hypothetical protein TNCV_3135161 [Trichonephila clavipes]|nr:hypothetical protein TNCV_3135161 [Trichonephila clavipes]